MKKFLFILFGVFAIAGAFAAGENVPTSKSYVDSKLGEKQDIISANDGAARVLTNTGTAGEYGTKGIYDANGEYATQTQNLVDAATMNAGVQNAINSEFQCIEWDEHGECLLLQLGGISEIASGYTRLEYIESTGTQYIDTGHIPTSLTRTEVDLKFTDDTYKSSGVNTIFGVADFHHIQAVYNINFGVLTIQGTELFPWLCAYGSTGCSNLAFSITHNAKTTRQTLVLDAKNKVVSYGTAKKSLANQTVQSPNASIYLFGQHRFESDGTESALPYSRNDGMFVYAARIYEDDSLVKNLVPARRDSDNRLGLYDTMTGAFLTNSGTGEFIGGPVTNMNLYLPARQ